MRDFLWSILTRKTNTLSLLKDATEMIEGQQKLLEIYRDSIDDWQRRALDAVRLQRELAIAFRVAVEKPEIDIRDDLDKLVSDLSDSIAQLEEQIVS